MEWRRIPDYPYEVSDEGDVRNIKTQRILKPQKINKYRMVQLGARNQHYIHKLVLLAFVGPADGRCVRHLDGDGSNNRLSNLEYGTMKENCDDRQRHGTWGWKLTDRHVRIIRGLHKCGFTMRRISAIIGVNRNHVSQIVRQQRWSHVA